MFDGDERALAKSFHYTYQDFARTYGIVTEFAHLHPWSSVCDILRDQCSYDRDVVWINTTCAPDVLFTDHLEHCCRKNINKAQREGVTIRVESCDEAIEEFCRIYIGTMQRNGAHDRYYFSAEFFKAIRDALPENARFVFAEYKGRMIAATLYMYDDHDVFSFLGGVDAEFNHLRPTNLIIWNTVVWAHEKQKARFILGGGLRPEDGIYRFKSTFSPLSHPFYVYKRIHMAEEYSLLEKRRSDIYGSVSRNGYFPSYRSAIPKTPMQEDGQ